jgi:hypothetical protein
MDGSAGFPARGLTLMAISLLLERDECKGLEVLLLGFDLSISE